MTFAGSTKYLRAFGFKANNDLFSEHSWYFRNALVRANYKNVAENIYATNTYLLRFFENLLLGFNHELKNREMHIRYAENFIDPIKPEIDPIKKKILLLLKQSPKLPYAELAQKMGCSTASIKRLIQELKKMGILERVGSNKTGYWKVLDR